MSFSLNSLILDKENKIVRYLIGYRVDLNAELTFDQIEEVAWFSYESDSRYLWRYGFYPREGSVSRQIY